MILHKGKIDQSKLIEYEKSVLQDIDWVEGYYISYGGLHEIAILSEDDRLMFVSVIPETVSEYIGIDDDANGTKIFNKDVVVVEFESEEHMIKSDGNPLVGFVTYEHGTYFIVESWSCATEFNENYYYYNNGSIYEDKNKEYLERYEEWKKLRSL